MPDAPTCELLLAAAGDVLETMFFTPVMGEAVPEALPAVPALAARLQYAGASSGTFTVRVSEQAALSITANFLGEEVSEPTPSQVRDVICELTNMICGSVLSRLDGEAHFDLGHPELVDAMEPVRPEAASRAFDVGEGEVAVFLHIDVAP